MRIQPLEIKTVLESNPLRSKTLVRRLAVCCTWRPNALKKHPEKNTLHPELSYEGARMQSRV